MNIFERLLLLPEPGDGGTPTNTGDTLASAGDTGSSVGEPSPGAGQAPAEPPDGKDLSTQTVPYSRFKEVNDRVKDLEAQVEQANRNGEQLGWRYQQELNRLQQEMMTFQHPRSDPQQVSREDLPPHLRFYRENEQWSPAAQIADDYSQHRVKTALDPVQQEIAQLKAKVTEIETADRKRVEMQHYQQRAKEAVQDPVEAELIAPTQWKSHPKLDDIRREAMVNAVQQSNLDPNWNYKTAGQREYDLKQLYKHHLKEGLNREAQYEQGIRNRTLEDLKSIAPAEPAAPIMPGQSIAPEHDDLYERWQRGEINDTEYQRLATERDMGRPL